MICFERPPSTVLAGETFKSLSSSMELEEYRVFQLSSLSRWMCDNPWEFFLESLVIDLRAQKVCLDIIHYEEQLLCILVWLSWHQCARYVSHFLASGGSWVAVWYQICSSRLLLILQGCLHLIFIKPTLELFLLQPRTWMNVSQSGCFKWTPLLFISYSGKNIHKILTSISYFWLLN